MKRFVPEQTPGKDAQPLGEDGAASEQEASDGDEPVIEIPINGTLDLHTFRPADVADLLPEYIGECLARDIVELRIIHGKGRGILRAHVRRILQRDPRVADMRNADEQAGSFGATLVTLRRSPAGQKPGRDPR